MAVILNYIDHMNNLSYVCVCVFFVCLNGVNEIVNALFSVFL